jgi:hypothetical protein
LNIEAVLPWFHCNPWPPTIRWDGHPTASDDMFQRTEPLVRDEPDVVEVPSDATPAGFALPAGEVFTAASDPDAVFVRLGDGRAERWVPPEVETGCVQHPNVHAARRVGGPVLCTVPSGNVMVSSRFGPSVTSHPASWIFV